VRGYKVSTNFTYRALTLIPTGIETLTYFPSPSGRATVFEVKRF